MKEERDGVQKVPARKMKFTPRVPPRKATKPTVVKLEQSETKDDILDKELLTKLNRSKANDGFARRFLKNEKKVGPSQVAFGHGSSSLAGGSFLRGRILSNQTLDGLDTSLSKLEKEYVEPWDYTNSYYPTTLPLRRPYSGNPEILDEEEFGEASRSTLVDDGSESNPAEELGLMEKWEETKLLLFQFPANLPLSKQNAPAKKGSKLEELQSGFMGKIMVYKSGKVKMKLGDGLYDISPGVKCSFSQEVAAINTKEKHCCALGEIDTRAVVTPDVDALLDSLDDFDLHLL